VVSTMVVGGSCAFERPREVVSTMVVSKIGVEPLIL
jgi:hypothetical protein